MPLTSPGNDDDTGENHQPTLRKNTAEPVEQTLKQNNVEGSEPETAGILLAHIDELGQALNQHYRPAQPRFSDDSDQ